ncbi:hypothetical protein Oant_0774 [Brucella anthropi ATCC 49188]|uniref:Uncharacterized protein n=1 Tax=Brucella anthropi (strain ATCC 49188 / DSM 6882 / CCUG 24695 / JCM 21032 / LMG 3331 / NBRC 15819 / NCTC 12168 / Alc 37) TaxID=439375 RepID=A6WWZ2_BRUA4|nr:hypothetical protein Oant_0774 [Brucella anthropi ATCC 49188]
MFSRIDCKKNCLPGRRFGAIALQFLFVEQVFILSGEVKEIRHFGGKTAIYDCVSQFLIGLKKLSTGAERQWDDISLTAVNLHESARILL